MSARVAWWWHATQSVRKFSRPVFTYVYMH
jgi:hypothetical protein